MENVTAPTPVHRSFLSSWILVEPEIPTFHQQVQTTFPNLFQKEIKVDLLRFRLPWLRRTTTTKLQRAAGMGPCEGHVLPW